jgi:hypothetical protein
VLLALVAPLLLLPPPGRVVLPLLLLRRCAVGAFPADGRLTSRRVRSFLLPLLPGLG